MADDEETFDFSKGRDLDQIELVLPGVLEASLEGVSNVRVAGLRFPLDAGRSNETVLFSATWRRDGRDESTDLVLRIAPRGHQMFIEADIRIQYDLLRALDGLGSVRVPTMLLFEADTALFGRPFFVMEQIHGRVPVSRPVYNKAGWLYDALPTERRTLWETAIEQLVNVNNVPLDAVGFLPKPPAGENGLTDQLRYWQRSMDFSAMGPAPDLFHVVSEWLEGHVPSDHTDGLSWGDARIGNMMFGDDFRLRAVLDWEQASRAGGLRDLGWWLFFDDFHSIDKGLRRLDGLGGREETIGYWEEHTGCRARDLQWYEVFTGFSVMQLWVRMNRLAGMSLDEAMATNAFVPRTLDLMGASVPVATAAKVRPS